jgi:hypothetical protein
VSQVLCHSCFGPQPLGIVHGQVSVSGSASNRRKRDAICGHFALAHAG